MDKLLQITEYLIVRIIIEIFRFIPFPLLYLFSNCLGFLMFALGYRKKIVFKNLRNSFPEKNDKEIKKIAFKYYIHLADIMLESLKGYTMPAKQFKKRYKLLNPEIDIEYYEKGLNVIYVGGHQGNWEWGTQATPFILKHKIIILYKPLKNKYLDDYIKKRRERFGVKMVSINLTAKSFKEQNEPYCVIMVSDQNPSNKEKAIWTKFLNQDTATLHGTELYAKLYRLPVIYFETLKAKRGFYELTLIPITDNPRDEEKGQITQKFMSLLEKSIYKQPETWLWSHKRWKYKR